MQIKHCCKTCAREDIITSFLGPIIKVQVVVECYFETNYTGQIERCGCHGPATLLFLLDECLNIYRDGNDEWALLSEKDNTPPKCSSFFKVMTSA